MSDLIIKKNGTDYKLPMLAEHYPADRVYLDGDINKNVQDEIDEVAGDISNLKSSVNTLSSRVIENNLDAPFAIDAYEPTLYTLLADGYLYIVTENAGSNAVVRVWGAQTGNYVEVRQSSNSSAPSSQTTPMFCKKGMRVGIVSKSADATVLFIPLF